MTRLVSFQRALGAGGWRYSLAYRTTYVSDRDAWVVQRWNGEAWEDVGEAASYAGAREVAGRDEEKREEARR